MDIAGPWRWYEAVPSVATSTRPEVHVVAAVVRVEVVVQNVQRTGVLVFSDAVHRPAALVILEENVVLHGSRVILPDVEADAAFTNRISVDVGIGAVGNVDRTQAAAVNQAAPGNVELGSGSGYEDLAAVVFEKTAVAGGSSVFLGTQG